MSNYTPSQESKIPYDSSERMFYNNNGKKKEFY